MRLQVFAIKKWPRQVSDHICLEVITIDSVIKKDENYCQQIILKEYNCIEQKNYEKYY